MVLLIEYYILQIFTCLCVTCPILASLVKIQIHIGFMRSAALEQLCSTLNTFSIWSASRRSLASLRLGLNVSSSSSVLMDAPCLEFTSSLVVIYKYKKNVRQDINTTTKYFTFIKHGYWVASIIPMGIKLQRLTSEVSWKM